jgi:hypothetical protein
MRITSLTILCVTTIGFATGCDRQQPNPQPPLSPTTPPTSQPLPPQPEPPASAPQR